MSSSYERLEEAVKTEKTIRAIALKARVPVPAVVAYLEKKGLRSFNTKVKINVIDAAIV